MNDSYHQPIPAKATGINPLLESKINSLKGKTVLITGGSRGIGKAIALRLASEGANIVIAAKTTEPHPRMEGTIYSAAKEIQALGVECLPIQCDIRYEDQIENTVQKTIESFGIIDILVNNASAISLTPTTATNAKQYDLMQNIQVRGTFLMCKACIPHLKHASNAHILNLSPPLHLNSYWFAKHLAYTISKYGMSMIVLGLAEELKQDTIAVNALWPQTTIATAAVQNILGGDVIMKKSRKPEIVADAAFYILRRSSVECTGNFFIDEEVLKAEGISDLDRYAVNEKEKLMKDIFLE